MRVINRAIRLPSNNLKINSQPSNKITFKCQIEKYVYVFSFSQQTTGNSIVSRCKTIFLNRQLSNGDCAPNGERNSIADPADTKTDIYCSIVPGTSTIEEEARTQRNHILVQRKLVGCR